MTQRKIKHRQIAVAIVVFSIVAILFAIHLLSIRDDSSRQIRAGEKESDPSRSEEYGEDRGLKKAESICGNDIVEGREVCDDGNKIDKDDCNNDCSINRMCEDGIFRGDFVIDDYRDIKRLAGCISVTGKLVIESSELTDLDLLKSLAYVKKGLYIRGNGKLNNVEGLRNLASVGVLVIENNPNMTNLDGLNKLEKIAGGVEISTNKSPSDYRGPSHRPPRPVMMTFFEESRISNNASLTDLGGLSNLRSIKTVLSIDNNASLTGIKGMNEVASISGLNIRNNINLTKLEGFNSLNAIEDSLTIHENPRLKDIDELANLSSINRGSLSISNNNKLTDLGGLNNLTRIKRKLLIKNNPFLTSLDLYNLREVDTNLEIEIGDNSKLNSIAGIVGVEGEVQSLIISGNKSLASLEGLNGIKSVRFQLVLENNDSLKNLKGLDSLNNVGMSLKISNNEGLVDLEGLNNLTTVVTFLEINQNKNLTSLKGLDNLDNITAQPFIKKNILVKNNTNLPTCEVISLVEKLEKEGNTSGAIVCGNHSDTCEYKMCN